MKSCTAQQASTVCQPYVRTFVQQYVHGLQCVCSVDGVVVLVGGLVALLNTAQECNKLVRVQVPLCDQARGVEHVVAERGKRMLIGNLIHLQNGPLPLLSSRKTFEYLQACV